MPRVMCLSRRAVGCSPRLRPSIVARRRTARAPATSHSARCALFYFFFQAEDGIRDVAVTGVQTCALPIYVHDHLCSGLCLGQTFPGNRVDAQRRRCRNDFVAARTEQAYEFRADQTRAAEDRKSVV